ncbi:MAG: hypothetical protein MJ172_03150 [Clostridia bacterium]|nr:hypothetical protein [Clostridia bacterium]
MSSDLKWYKENDTDLIWWIDTSDQDGLMLFSFDKKTVFNMFKDYPYKLTVEQKKIFDKENPFWAEFFKDRNNR